MNEQVDAYIYIDIEYGYYIYILYMYIKILLYKYTTLWIDNVFSFESGLLHHACIFFQHALLQRCDCLFRPDWEKHLPLKLQSVHDYMGVY